MLSLSSHPALSLWKSLPVLHTTVQPLHKSNKEEIIHLVRRGTPREAFSLEQMGSFTFLSGGHYSLSGGLWPHFSPANPSRCRPYSQDTVWAPLTVDCQDLEKGWERKTLKNEGSSWRCWACISPKRDSASTSSVCVGHSCFCGNEEKRQIFALCHLPSKG